jgi:2-polyprenyl-3-methyl-5-hydroxy-6-metoxy-1,4-benzoquinol methylase|tara:strand:+ start:2228 stop:3430 length:1203 start_codon:yes stop_codon:yes gene_type:complete
MRISDLQFFKRGKHEGKLRVILDGKKVAGEALECDDSYYIEREDGVGLKIIKNNPFKYASLEETNKNLSYFKSKNFDIFPKIIEHNVDSDYILMKVEHLEKQASSFTVPKWVPEDHHKFLQDKLPTSISLLNKFNNTFIKENLFPEDEWCKKKNIVGDKVVDFHRFKVHKDRYQIPARVSSKDCKKIFDNAVKRYLARGDNKWKGKIYQGHIFNNGHVFEGYSSDGVNFDSYRKLNFYYMNKAENNKVLDLGCNEGFFSTQASLAGASSVTGVDLCKEDIQLSKEIRDEITGLDNIEYIQADAVDFVKNDKNKYNLTFLSSVLHQIYPNNKGAENFLHDIASKTEYLCLETPLDHKLMDISPKSMYNFLSKFFDLVRILFVYDAYSSGYRAIFVCWRPKP